jgi:signal transduction histidine kinase
MTAPLEELLRETLDRLRRQEERTAALESALFDTPPPTVAGGDTVLAPWPTRPPALPRAPRPECPPAAVSPAAVLASLDDVVWSVSPDGQFVHFAAGAVEHFYGQSAHELQAGRGRWLEAFPPDDRDALRHALMRLPDTDTFQLAHRVETAAGSRWAVTRGKLVRDRDGRPLRIDGSTREGTDRDELQARLAEAEQRARGAEVVLREAAHLATAGRVATGVAHDFHNLLGVIAGNAELLREGLPPTDPLREAAETIVRTAQAVAGVSRKVLAIGRPGAPQVVPIDVSVALRAIEPILRRLIGKPVRLDFELAPELPLIRADLVEFDRAVLNLVLNARDATSVGGNITVRAASAEVESRPFVALTVADTGCGMSAEVRERMFELFFTTKGERGTGLGLATVRDAVVAVGGHVAVESEVGWGTQIRVYWPAF